MKKSIIPQFLFLLCLCTSQLISAQSEWSYLLTKKNKAAFQQLNGTATFKVKGKKLIGVSKLNTPNSFLATKKHYTDFILEFEVKIDTGLNSGVQIRSNTKPDYYEGAVHGYQVEIETSPRKWAGGVYDESRRGWLYPLTENKKGQEAWNNNKWNHYRIEAIGDEIKTWVNGIPCSYLIDDMTAKGFIAFQVHAIDAVHQEGKKVRWRNIRIKTNNLSSSLKKDPQPAPVIHAKK